eukprot:7152100-Prymnesium_polylepis.1
MHARRRHARAADRHHASEGAQLHQRALCGRRPLLRRSREGWIGGAAVPAQRYCSALRPRELVPCVGFDGSRPYPHARAIY